MCFISNMADIIINSDSSSAHHSRMLCSICCNEKEPVHFLVCGEETCSYKACHGCMSLQLGKFLSKYDFAWTGAENKEVVLDENIDLGGTTWTCPLCDRVSVITESDLMLCAEAKTTRDDALAVLKG